MSLSDLVLGLHSGWGVVQGSVFKIKSAVGKAGGRVEGGLGLALEALHVHSPVRTPSSGDASRGPRQTAGNSTSPALCCARLPLFLSSPSPQS